MIADNFRQLSMDSKLTVLFMHTRVADGKLERATKAYHNIQGQLVSISKLVQQAWQPSKPQTVCSFSQLTRTTSFYESLCYPDPYSVSCSSFHRQTHCKLQSHYPLCEGKLAALSSHGVLSSMTLVDLRAMFATMQSSCALASTLRIRPSRSRSTLPSVN